MAQGDAFRAPTRAPIELLREAVIAVGDAFGIRADCAGAAALLKLTAGHLGYQLTPRPVSLTATHIPSETILYMGRKATAAIPDSAMDRVTDLRPAGTDTGHLVLTMDRPEKLMFDPNLRQLGTSGIEAPSLVYRVLSTDPESGEWMVALEDFGLVLQYRLDEECPTLMDWYKRALVHHESNALELAEMLLSGMSAETIRALLT